MPTPNAKGFTACGQYYVMDEEHEGYHNILKRLLREIRETAIKNK